MSVATHTPQTSLLSCRILQGEPIAGHWEISCPGSDDAWLGRATCSVGVVGLAVLCTSRWRRGRDRVGNSWSRLGYRPCRSDCQRVIGRQAAQQVVSATVSSTADELFWVRQGSRRHRGARARFGLRDTGSHSIQDEGRGSWKRRSLHGGFISERRYRKLGHFWKRKTRCCSSGASKEAPQAIFDLKTGSAALSSDRISPKSVPNFRRG